MRFAHTLKRDDIVIMPGVPFPLVVSVLIPGLDMAVVRRLFAPDNAPTANVRASGLTLLDTFLRHG